MNKLRKKVSLLIIFSILFANINFSFASSYDKVTKEEVSSVETEILSLQKTIYDSLNSSFEEISKKYSKLTNYTESWNLEMNLNVDDNMFFWKLESTLQMNDYNAKQSWLDTELSSDINFNATYNPVYWTWFELDLTTFASMISKDSDLYLLLKDLDFKVDEESIKTALDSVKERFKDNKYLKIPADVNSQMMMNMFKDIYTWDSLKGFEENIDEPFFTTYGKKWDKYLLVPTKHACETYFEVENKIVSISPFAYFYTPTECNDLVYKWMVKKFLENWELYVTLWDENNTLGYELNNGSATINSTLNYDNSSILSYNLDIIPNQVDFPWESFNLEYKKNNFLNYSLKSEKSNMNFNSKLNNDNKFSLIDFNFNFWNDFVWTFVLESNNFKWDFYFKDKWYDYDYETGEFNHKLKNIFAWRLSWTLKDDNSLNSLSLKIAWIWVEDKNVILLWNLKIDDKNFTWKLKFNDWTWDFIIKSNGKYDNKYFLINWDFDYANMYSWDFSLETDTRDNDNILFSTFLNVNSLDKEVFNFNITSDAKREFWDVEIEVPEDFEEIDVYEMMWWDNYYDDMYYDEDDYYNEELPEDFSDL